MKRAIVACIVLVFVALAAQPVVGAGDYTVPAAAFEHENAPLPSAAGGEKTIDAIARSIAAGMSAYHSYDAKNSMVKELYNLSAQFSSLCKVVSIGKTWQGRDILAVKVSDNVGTEETGEPEVLFDSSHHAREWMTTELAIFIIHFLVEGYASNATIKSLVDSRQVWVIPEMNPDGRVYDSYGDGTDPANNRMWRKNARDNDGNGMLDDGDGVDLNRNYGYKWANGGSSTNPADDLYMGPAPFSEPETRALRDFALNHSFSTHISYHSYSQYYLYPWDWSYSPCPDDGLFAKLGQELVNRSGNSAGSKYPYEAGQSSTKLYQCSGTTSDYMYGELGAVSLCEEIYPNVNDDDANVTSPYDLFHPKASQIPLVLQDNIKPALYLVEIADNPWRLLDRHVKVTPGSASATVFPGDNATINITMLNNGAQNDTYSIASDCPAGIAVAAPAKVSLATGESIEIAVTVSVDSGAAGGKPVAYVNVSSENDTSAVGTVTVALTVPFSDDAAVLAVAGLPQGGTILAGTRHATASVANLGTDPVSGLQVECKVWRLGPNTTATTLFMDNFDGADKGWTVQNSGGADWQRGAPAYGPTSVPSSPNCYGTALGGNYPDNANDWLISPPVLVPENASLASLSFSRWYRLHHAGSDYDDSATMRVWSGTAWDTLATYRGDDPMWRLRSYDLLPYKGREIRIAFVLSSDASGTAAGLYLDNVNISAALYEQKLAYNGTATVAGPLDFNETGQASWDIPLGEPGMYLARISTLLPGDGQPANDARSVEFTVSSLAVNITAPQESEPLVAGMPIGIQWDAQGGTGPIEVVLEYSQASGAGPYFELAAGLPASGSRAYTPPQISEVWLRATATDGAMMSVACIRHYGIIVVPSPEIAIDAPLDYDVWYADESHYINWTSSSGTAPYSVDLSYAMTYPGEASGTIASGLPQTGSYSWKMPLGTMGGIFRITARVVDFYGKNATASASVVVLPAFVVEVAPAAASLKPGETAMFRAQAYQMGMDGSMTPITSGIIYSWQVMPGVGDGTASPAMGNTTIFTATQAGDCTLAALGMRASDFTAGSPGTAAVTVYLPPPPQATLVHPDGGERYSEGGICDIQWNIAAADNSSAPYNVTVFYAPDGANFTSQVASMEQAAAGNGSYAWKLPANVSGSANGIMLVVRDKFGQYSNATSAGGFTVSRPAELKPYYGHNTEGIAGRSAYLSVIAIDQDGFPVSGVSVDWTVSSHPDGATLQGFWENSSISGPDGIADNHMHLGEVAGDYWAAASSGQIPGKTVLMRAIAVPGSPASVSVDPPEATVPLGKTQDFTASVYDEYGNEISDAVLAWSVQGGIGEVGSGFFTAQEEGFGQVIAACDNATGYANVTVISLPRVEDTQPAEGATGVPLDGDIIITFTHAMDRPSVESALSVSPEAGFIPEWIGDALLLRPTGGFALAPGASYTVTINATCAAADGDRLDGNGNGFYDGVPADNFALHFTAYEPPAEQPTVLLFGPHGTGASPGARVFIIFSQPMERPSAEDAFRLTQNGTPVKGNYSWSDDGTYMEFIPEEKLEGSAQYRAMLNLSQARGGNGLPVKADPQQPANGYFIWEFVTAKEQTFPWEYFYLAVLFTTTAAVIAVAPRSRGEN